MTSDEFREALARLDLSQRFLASTLGVANTTVNRWACGTVPVPQYAVAWIELADRLNQDRPIPS